MTPTSKFSYQEIREILSIFFDIPTGKIECWNMKWTIDADKDYLDKKIEQHQAELDAEHKAE